MMRLLVNALAASAGGGLTYLGNFVRQLSQRNDVEATVWLTPPTKTALLRGNCPVNSARLHLLEGPSGSSISRFWREQTELPGILRSRRADVLLSTGNIALWNSPVPQILLSRNALYTSDHFFPDLRARHAYSLWLMEVGKRFLARRSVAWADCTIAPSTAFAKQLKAWAGRPVVVVHHGFDRETFFAGQRELPEEVRAKLQAADGCVRLLFVSHYNYYRNFETLLRAVPLIRQQLAPLPVRLFLTCKFRSELNPGSYMGDSDLDLVHALGIRDEVVELGTISYDLLHHLYAACHLYVTPAYAESFAHPLVEAMASGLPVVASDLAVHQEICRDSAVYFPVFSPAGLAQKVFEVVKSPESWRQLAESGQQRAKDFSWDRHVERILCLARRLASGSLAELLPLSFPAEEPSQIAQLRSS